MRDKLVAEKDAMSITKRIKIIQLPLLSKPFTTIYVMKHSTFANRRKNI